MDIVTRLPSTARAPAEARRALRALAGVVPGPVLADAELVVSELVTNSVRHAPATPIEVRVTVGRDRLHIVVQDGGMGFEPVVEPPGELRRARWGLYLVDRLADRWGVEGVGRVWVELSRRPGCPGPHSP
jgi:anti-sigma regulatory factor (Ser/Thr protein kinase)